MLLDVFGTQEALDKMGAAHPIGRIGRPEEIADAVAWLFSDRSSYYTGQSLTLDGGLTAQHPYVTQSAGDKLLQNASDEKCSRIVPVSIRPAKNSSRCGSNPS